MWFLPQEYKEENEAKKSLRKFNCYCPYRKKIIFYNLTIKMILRTTLIILKISGMFQKQSLVQFILENDQNYYALGTKRSKYPKYV